MPDPDTPPAPGNAAEAIAGALPAGAPPAAAAGDPPAGDPPAADPFPAYMREWPEDLRTDPDLTRYKTPEDMAKGLKETRAWARGRVPIPTDEAGFRELGEKLRAEAPDKYDIPLPEGDDGALAGQFKQFAFDTGLPPQWARSIAEFHNRHQAEALSKVAQQNTDGLRAIELELGPVGYNTRLDAVNNMLQAAGIDDFDAVTTLTQAVGAEKTLRSLFTLAEKYGELEKVDTTGVELRMGVTTAAQAKVEIGRMFDDPAVAAKLKDHTSAEYKRYEQLLARQARGD